jgi:hypothetical protein
LLSDTSTTDTSDMIEPRRMPGPPQLAWWISTSRALITSCTTATWPACIWLVREKAMIAPASGLWPRA